MAACRYGITILGISRESALNEGYIELITWREIALVQYNSRCEFILIDSVMTECNISCSEEKPIFILQLELMLFTMKDRNLNFLAADFN